MSLPPFAPYPAANLKQDIKPEQWETCLDSWISLSELYLRLASTKFAATLHHDESLTRFLASYYYESRREHVHGASSRTAKEQSLRKAGFLLTHRALLDIQSPLDELLKWEFLADFSHAYLKSQSLELLHKQLWQKRRDALEGSLQAVKVALIKKLESSQPDTAEDELKQLSPLIYASSDAGAFLMTGSDLVDALATSYPKVSPVLRQSLVTLTYLGLLSLTKGEKPNHSMLFDHLYSLKNQSTGSSSLLHDLVTNTPIMSKLTTSISGKNAERARTLAASLKPFRSHAAARQPRSTSRKRSAKAKGKAVDSFGYGAFSGDQHVHRMSLISQIQDLFPHLGSGFIAQLLDTYSEDAEQVTAHLLDDSLPPHLDGLDRTMQLTDITASHKEQSHHDIEHLAPGSTPPPQRRNVFDNDEFDRLEVDASRMHIGRRNEKLTADAILTDRSKAPNKSAILSALAAFDSDDDERDDTYDEADVGGTVDGARPDGEEDPNVRVDTDESGNEEALFRAWRLDPNVFGRTSDVRRSAARAALKSETNMVDEAIEGWGIMLARDPRRARRLEMRYSAFDGMQANIDRTSYREGEDTESDGPGGRGGFGGRGRGRGRGAGRGGGRGGNVAGSANDNGTQVARNRKEASKGSRANHNRRDQRAKKMARGGFPG